MMTIIGSYTCSTRFTRQFVVGCSTTAERKGVPKDMRMVVEMLVRRDDRRDRQMDHRYGGDRPTDRQTDRQRDR
jgi:hypothetical protein